jgi:20S proteasome subunit beta 3
MKRGSFCNYQYFPSTLIFHSRTVRFGPYFVEPVIAGLDKDNKPFICSYDLIGCPNYAKDFVVSGVSSENCFGMCEALYEEDLVG